MKNIHVLPTDKPSRLYFDVVIKELFLQRKLNIEATSFPIEKRNIYITNDEKIKEGDWMLDTIQTCLQPIELATKESIFLLNTPEQGWKKIILTDNTDLIKDGVQAIDDEFLEWFVNNPSCEVVEVESFCKNGDNCPSLGAYDKQNLCDVGYKIIIPKEQQKQHLIDIMRSDEELGLYDEQETLEEVAENYINKQLFDFGDLTHVAEHQAKQAFKNGYKLAQQQNKNLYSEY